MPHFRPLSWALALTLPVFMIACSDSTKPGNDGGTPHDSGSASPDTSASGDAALDSASASDGSGQPDAPAGRTVELGDDDGIPAIKLFSQTGAVAYTRFTPKAELVPVKPLSVRMRVVSDFSATLSFHPDVDGSPGASVGAKPIQVFKFQWNQWVTFDVSSLDLTFTGPFWVGITFTDLPYEQADGGPDADPFLQYTVYGSSSTSGTTQYTHDPDYNAWTPNFDTLYRVQVFTADTSEPQLGADGDSCQWAGDCASGYCLANKCTVACTGTPVNECGTGRRCEEFQLNTKVCVTECSDVNPCPAGSICLVNDILTHDLMGAWGFCVKAGPWADGTDCQTHYHTICESGYCSACGADAKCDSPGTCQPL